MRKAKSNQEFALAALAAAGAEAGAFIEAIDEGDDTTTYLFESKLKGYLDWRWSVTVYEPVGQEPTLSELLLLPGENSLIAPDWVPWSERLADYKALQLELERQAALEAEEAEDSDDIDDDAEDDDADDFEETDDGDEPEEGEETELALAVPEEGQDAEDDSDDAGVRPPRSRGRNRRGRGKQNNKDS